MAGNGQDEPMKETEEEQPEDGLWSPYEESSEGGSGPQCQVSCKLKSPLWI